MPRINYRDIPDAAPSPGGLKAWLAERPQMPYILPFFAFVLLMLPAAFPPVGGINFESLWKTYNPAVYAAKSLAAAILLWYFWPAYGRIRWSYLGTGLLIGLLGTPIWIGIHYACLATGIWHTPSPDSLYNPDLMLPDQLRRWAFLCIRIAGPTLVVPPMEELFFRDFLMRALVRGERFEDVPVGTYTPLSLFGMAAFFGLNHGSMWPAGVVYGLMMGILLIRTKSLGACMVAHGATNFTLYLYCLWTADWQFM
jgi:CAAX prenyl protease-like protein